MSINICISGNSDLVISATKDIKKLTKWSNKIHNEYCTIIDIVSRCLFISKSKDSYWYDVNYVPTNGLDGDGYVITDKEFKNKLLKLADTVRGFNKTKVYYTDNVPMGVCPYFCFVAKTYNIEIYISEKSINIFLTE